MKYTKAVAIVLASLLMANISFAQGRAIRKFNHPADNTRVASPVLQRKVEEKRATAYDNALNDISNSKLDRMKKKATNLISALAGIDLTLLLTDSIAITAVVGGVLVTYAAGKYSYEKAVFSGPDMGKYYPDIAKALYTGQVFKSYRVILVDGKNMSQDTTLQKHLAAFLKNPRKEVPYEKIVTGGDYRFYFYPYEHRVFADVDMSHGVILVRNTTFTSATEKPISHFIEIRKK